MGILLWVMSMLVLAGYVWVGEWRRTARLMRAADDAWPREYCPRHAAWLPEGRREA